MTQVDVIFFLFCDFSVTILRIWLQNYNSLYLCNEQSMYTEQNTRNI